MKTFKKVLKVVAVILAWLVIWEIVYLIVGKDIIVPSPISVFARLGELIITTPFWQAIGASLLRILIGYVCALIVGAAFGILTSFSKIADAFFTPAANVVRATPVVSFILLLFVFAAKNNIPAITAFLMVTPIVWANVHSGIKSADSNLLKMARTFKLSKRSKFVNIYFPAAMPNFMTAAKMGIGFAWKSGIAAEVLINPNYGIGAALFDSKIYLETTDLFAWTIVIILLSFLLEKLLVWLVGKIYRKAIKHYKNK